MSDFAKLLIFFGLILIIAGFLVQFVGKIPGFGRLPGDFLIKKTAHLIEYGILAILIFRALIN
jgi:hypothetical protein